MAKAIRSEVPVVFQLQEDGDHFMIGSEVGKFDEPCKRCTLQAISFALAT